MIKKLLVIIIVIFLPWPVFATEKNAAPEVEKPKEATPGPSAIQNGILDVRMATGNKSFSLIFPFGHEVPAASFLRGSYLWVVFGEHAEIKIPDFAPNGFFTAYDQLPSQDFTIVRFDLADSYSPTDGEFYVNFEKGEWQVVVDKSPTPQGTRSPITVKVEEGKIFLPVLKTGEPLKITDPQAGDDIVIVPVSAPGVGILPGRKFVDATLEQAMQGVVISNLSDSAEYHVVRDGIEISGSRAAHITDKTDRKDEGGNVRSLLPFNYRYSGDLENDRRALMRQIIALPEKERTNKRFDLARLYFANRFYPDARGVLNEIKISDPDFAATEQARMILGATDFLMRRYTEALKIFEKLEADDKDSPNLPEVKLWRWASNLRLGDDTKSADWQQQVSDDKEFMKLHQEIIKSKEDVFTPGLPFLRKYPDYVANNFYLMAAREKTGKGDFDSAELDLDDIAKDKPAAEMTDSVNFLRAAIDEKRGDFQGAEVTWRKLSQNINDPQNRARSLLYLTNLELSQGKISKADAIKKLEPLTVVWRGDQGELELLNYLAQLYYGEKQYLKAFQTWRTLVTNFANTSEAVEVASRMQDDFIKLFDGGGAYDMPPLEALSLYFEYRELTPLGPKGDRIIRKLADHFIDADLLDSAATLLSHQIRYRSTGEEKLDMVEKLVDVYMMNKKPEEALAVLDVTEGEKMTEARKQKRLYLRVEILADLGKNDEAVALLKGDNSKKAYDMREGIYWETRDWKQLMGLLEPAFSVPKDQPLTEEETRRAMHLAFAYAFSGEDDQLKQFGKDYSGLISNEGDKKLFDFLTQGHEKLDRYDLEDSAQVDDVSSYLAEYNKAHNVNADALPAAGAGGQPETAGASGSGGAEGAAAGSGGAVGNAGAAGK